MHRPLMAMLRFFLQPSTTVSRLTLQKSCKSDDQPQKYLKTLMSNLRRRSGSRNFVGLSLLRPWWRYQCRKRNLLSSWIRLTDQFRSLQPRRKDALQRCWSLWSGLLKKFDAISFRSLNVREVQKDFCASRCHSRWLAAQGIAWYKEGGRTRDDVNLINGIARFEGDALFHGYSQAPDFRGMTTQ